MLGNVLAEIRFFEVSFNDDVLGLGGPKDQIEETLKHFEALVTQFRFSYLQDVKDFHVNLFIFKCILTQRKTTIKLSKKWIIDPRFNYFFYTL